MSDVEVGAAPGAETRQEAESRGSAPYWLSQIELAEKEAKDWRDTGMEAIRRYRSESERPASALFASTASHFNLFYSNIEVWRAALFQRVPEPDVRRRYMDRDPVGRFVSEMVERALVYFLDRGGFERAAEVAVQDYKLVGRSAIRLRYDPTIVQVPTGVMELDPETGEVRESMSDALGAQDVTFDTPYWEDIIFPAVRTYTELNWMAFRHYFSRDELRELNEEIADKVPLVWKPERLKDIKVNEYFMRAEVFEVWDRDRREVIWVARGFDEVLAVDADPLNLEDFFPIPIPMSDIETSDTITPVLEYTQVKPLFDELDEIQNRIRKLTKALKRRGVYDETVEGLQRLESASDNEFIPVDNDTFARILQAGGIESVLMSEGIEPIAKVIISLYQQRDQLKQTIFEVIGIADVMRGEGQASEKATMTKVKAQFGSMRLKLHLRVVANHFRDLMRMAAEVISEKFDLDILLDMTGMRDEFMALAQQIGADPTDEVLRLMRDDRLRSVRIDIETDSTIAGDSEESKRSFVELLQASSQFAQVIGQMPQTVQPFFLKMFVEGFKRFKVGRNLEDDLESTIAAMMQPQPEKPNIDMMKLELDAKKSAASNDIEMAKIRQKESSDARKAQVDLTRTIIDEQSELAREERQPMPQFGLEMQNA